MLVSFAINHMTIAQASYQTLLDIGSSLGCVGVEVRNDLVGELFDGVGPEAAGSAARAKGLRILALSEVKSFNDFSDQKRQESIALMDIAVACGAEAISLIPRNDGLAVDKTERISNLTLALTELKPLLASRNLVGLIEPLGFEICSLRYKSEVVDVIESLDAAGQFKLVHDTFHHYLAGGGPVFPEHTGIVHVSGVTDTTLAATAMLDDHRVLVDAHDRLENISQLRHLHAQGYRGPISFEAFSPTVHAFTDPRAELSGSFAYIASSITATAA